MVLEHGGDPNILEPVGDQIYNSPDTPIFSACSVGNLESVKTLVKHGANIHVIGTRGRNVVGWSASHGSPIVTQWLLENGADWTVQDVEGTAVAEAELHREFDPTEEPEKAAAHEWILKFLAEKGVDLKAAEEKSRAIYLKNFRPREAAKQAKKP